MDLNEDNILSIKTLFNEIYSDYNIDIQYKGERKFSILYNNNELFILTFELNNTLEIQGVQGNHTKIGDILSKLIIFSKVIREFIYLKSITIGGDTSNLNFNTIDNNLYQVTNKRGVKSYQNFRLELKYLNIFAYGMSWYNRIGFGDQSIEIKNFIKTPFISYLKEIKYNDIELWNVKYKDCLICDVFKDIIRNLKLITLQRINKINIVKNDDLDYLLNVRNLLDYMSSYEDIYEGTYDDPIYFFIPRINGYPEYIF